MAVIGETQNASNKYQNLPLACLKPSKSIVITPLRNQSQYNLSIVEKAKTERDDLVILQ